MDYVVIYQKFFVAYLMPSLTGHPVLYLAILIMEDLEYRIEIFQFYLGGKVH